MIMSVAARRQPREQEESRTCPPKWPFRAGSAQQGGDPFFWGYLSPFFSP